MPMTLPAANDDYATLTYWNARYESEHTTYDWFNLTWKELEAHLSPYVEKTSIILMLGCGNSVLSQQMYAAGYENIVNLDYSQAVIHNMQALNPEMQWVVGDVRSLPFDNESLDVMIDKGTMDAMLAIKHDPWNPPATLLADCNSEVDEALRVLKPGGVFLYITWGQPHFRKKILTRPNADLHYKGIDDSVYFLYILKKR